VVPTVAAQVLLEQCGVSTVPSTLVRDPEEAVMAAKRLGFPVALKIESRDILHKTEVGGVILDLSDEAAIRAAFPTLLENARRHRPRAHIEGVVVQTMAQGWLELVIGLQNDPVFGMVIMVGLGGIHVEALKDVVFRAAPVTPDEAGRMLDALRARTLLDGARGHPPVDRDSLARLISAVSRLGAAAGDRLEELDLNPVLAGPDGAVAVDWLMISK
jgi:acetyltransferase